MTGLGAIASRNHLAVQSHLSEKLSEIDWEGTVPDSENYMGTYINAGLAAPGRKSIMAHCVYSDEREIQMMKDNDTYAVHCPQCNMNIASALPL